MINFRIDRASPVPAYAQLVAQVREAIRLGWVQPGDQLPTVREVVASATVNPNTVLKAYRELSSRGVVVARQGAGTFVASELQPVDHATLRHLRTQFDAWVAKARAAGLDREDMAALVNAALAELGEAEPGVVA